LEDFGNVTDKTKAEVFIFWVRLCAIIGRVAKYLSRSSTAPAAPFPVDLGKALIDWAHSLPPYLQLPIQTNVTTTFNCDVHQLHLPYLATIAVLYLKRSSQSLPQASPAAIFAASCVARVLKDVLARARTRSLMAITCWYSAVAFIALLRASWIESLSKHANEDLDILTLNINQLRNMWPTANVFYQGFLRLRASNSRDSSPRPGQQDVSTYAGRDPISEMNANLSVPVMPQAGTADVDHLNMESESIDWTEYFPFATSETSGITKTLLMLQRNDEPFPCDGILPEPMTAPDLMDMFNFVDYFPEMNLFTQ